MQNLKLQRGKLNLVTGQLDPLGGLPSVKPAWLRRNGCVVLVCVEGYIV